MTQEKTRAGLFLLPEPTLSITTVFLDANGISCIPNASTFESSKMHFQSMKRLGAHIAILGLIDRPEETVQLYNLIRTFSEEQTHPTKFIGLIDKAYIDHFLVNEFDKTISWTQSTTPILITLCHELANQR